MLVTEVVPDVHLPAQGPDLNDGLAQEVVGFPLEALLDTGLDVIVLVPHTDFDAVRGVMALAGEVTKSKPQDEQQNLSSYSPSLLLQTIGTSTEQELGKRADGRAPIPSQWALCRTQAAPAQPGSAPIVTPSWHKTEPQETPAPQWEQGEAQLAPPTLLGHGKSQHSLAQP